jgi:hypothetical protein
MKKKIGKYVAAGLLLFISISSFSQDNERSTPAWVSDQGYWVVESNLHQPLQHTVRFYNNEHIIIATKDISGTKLNVKKRKVKMQLKSMLESSLLAWAAKEKAAAGNADLAKKP